MIPEAVEFVKSFFEDSKPVAAICHGPWMLLEADAVRGKGGTSWPSLKTDLRNAGANWSDQEVIADGNIVTSRKPADIAAFNRKMIELFSERTQGHPVGRGPREPSDLVEHRLESLCYKAVYARRIGNWRIRVPVAAKIAFAIAGAVPGVVASPMPPGFSWLGTM